jgi:acetyl/propionyl-CoA carboxylase alpha subunit
MRAAGELGLRTVAVYSAADAGAPHTLAADEAVLIGPADARQSYLNVDAILAAAEQSGASAVHPGYGFLAENTGFAEAVIAAGLAWVGPPPEAMRLMGDKARARALMEAAGVPLLPGYQGKDDLAALKKAAGQIGFPLLVKAAAGGGGVGMRVVQEVAQLEEAVEAARRTAQAAFGDGRLLLERYLPLARHVEIQVLGDAHGNLLHLFERECSAQRRHQKIVEESPSPLLDEELRSRMGAAALAAARAAGYQNAGTVEFLVDPATREFYFLEMNTRLQVEHPVTEMVTGLDIVQWQLRIAGGEHLPFKQEELKQRGHAIECRIYAEDPASGFLPQAGRLLTLAWPEGAGIRVDAGVAEGQDIGANYDPLLAKLITWGEDRPAALRRMAAALAETVLLGLTTNIDFLQDLIAHPAFQAGEVDTGFVERELAAWSGAEALPDAALLAAGLAELDLGPPAANGRGVAENDRYSPWKKPSGFRIGGGR